MTSTRSDRSDRSTFEERLLVELKDEITARNLERSGALSSPDTVVRGARRSRVPVWRLAVAAGVAGVLAAGILVVQVIRADDLPAEASAAQVLHGAALAARLQPALTARPDQYVFTEFLGTYREEPVSGPYHTNRIQQWVTAGDGDQWQRRGRPESEPDGWREVPPREGTPRPAGYLTGLPTDPDGMLRYLRDNPPDLNLPAGADEAAIAAEPTTAFTTATWLLDGYLPPESMGALFEAMARVPGVIVVPGGVKDAAGRHGIALRTPGVIGATHDVIFDRETYAYLGTRMMLVRDGKESLYLSTARLRTAIVDHPGQLP
ncbi:CU044_5270 family protein [Micromonospora sp. NPDC004704]